MAKKSNLQIQLDELREELKDTQQQLKESQTELQKAREEQMATTLKADRYREEREALKADMEKLQGVVVLQDQKLKEATRPEEDVEEWHREVARLNRELEQAHSHRELEVLRAVGAARDAHDDKERSWLARERAWTEREKRLKEEVQELRAQLKKEGPRPPEEAPRGDDATDRGRESTEEPGDSSTTPRTSDVGPTSVLAGMQQIPDLPRFDGSKLGEAETIEDWLDQLEIVAIAFRWEEDARLAHLVSRLKGPALAYYRSCSTETKRSYT